MYSRAGIAWGLYSALTLPIIHLSMPFNIDVKTPFIYEGLTGSYFGFSTELLSNSSGKWILVGSPKAESDIPLDGVTRLGALYRCRVEDNQTCQQMPIDQLGNGGSTSIVGPYRDEKSYEWLGFNIALSDDIEPKLVTCAPMWKSVLRRQTTYDYAQQGLCYEMNDGKVTEKRPLLNRRKLMTRTGTNEYIYAQGGFSVIYAKGKKGDKAKLILGIPGLRDNTGGFVEVGKFDRSSQVRYGYCPGSYKGYSISSGNIYGPGKVGYLIGAPKCLPGGIIQIVNGQLMIQTTRKGDQFGSFFGASVCAVDFDGDGLDDVVVGAPLYSTTRSVEVGRVYVYRSHGTGDLGPSETPVILKGGDNPRSRFGQTVANIGDINLDKFEDLAVGAPYEEDLHGAVYIFNGGSGGVPLTASQVIKGRVLESKLQTFGWSISHGEDMDNNSFPDFSVGGYLSDQVVLLRSRPVVKIASQFLVKPPQINANLPAPIYVNISLCLRYTSPVEINTIDVMFTMRSDTSRQASRKPIRAKFSHKTSMAHQFSEKLILSQKQLSCHTVQALITPDRDLLLPIQFEANFSLVEPSDILPPIFDAGQITHLTAKASFLNECGPDEKCIPDLQVKRLALQLEGSNALVIGKTSTCALEISLRSAGEDAYGATLNVYLPNGVNYVGVKSSSVVICGESHLQTVSCDLGNPYKSNSDIAMEIKVTLQDVAMTTSSLMFSVDLTSSNAEENSTLADNHDSTVIFTKLDVDLVIESESFPEQLIYDRDVEDNKTPFNVSHVINIMNSGPSFLPQAKVVLLLPHSDEQGEVTLIDLSSLQVQIAHASSLGSDPVQCIVNPTLILPSGRMQGSITMTTIAPPTVTNTSDTNVAVHSNQGDGQNASKDSQLNQKPDQKRQPNAMYAKEQNKNTKYLSCSTHRCISVTCPVGQLLIGQSVDIDVSTLLYQSTFVKNAFTGIFMYETKVSVFPESRIGFPAMLSDKPTSIVVNTAFLPEPPKESVALWVIIVSVVAGFLLLLLIAFLFAKFGFFKRKKHEEVEDWKRKSGYNRSSRQPSSYRSSTNRQSNVPTEGSQY